MGVHSSSTVPCPGCLFGLHHPIGVDRPHEQTRHGPRPASAAVGLRQYAQHRGWEPVSDTPDLRSRGPSASEMLTGGAWRRSAHDRVAGAPGLSRSRFVFGSASAVSGSVLVSSRITRPCRGSHVQCCSPFIPTRPALGSRELAPSHRCWDIPSGPPPTALSIADLGPSAMVHPPHGSIHATPRRGTLPSPPGPQRPSSHDGGWRGCSALRGAVRCPCDNHALVGPTSRVGECRRAAITRFRMPHCASGRHLREAGMERSSAGRRPGVPQERTLPSGAAPHGALAPLRRGNWGCGPEARLHVS